MRALISISNLPMQSGLQDSGAGDQSFKPVCVCGWGRFDLTGAEWVLLPSNRDWWSGMSSLEDGISEVQATYHLFSVRPQGREIQHLPEASCIHTQK